MPSHQTTALSAPVLGRRQALGWLAVGGLCWPWSWPAWADPPPALLLANPHGPHIDPRRYLVSEKLDGVRAFWDGRQLRLRSGQRVQAPAWFLARLPAGTPLDGELWLGRGRFDQLSGTVRKLKPVDAEWRSVRYMLFELPDAPGSFSQRVQRLAGLVRRLAWPAVQLVPQRQVASAEELQQLLRQTVQQGGEGLMLHLADAPYSTGRSDHLVKLKPWLDAEATVVGHRPGKGRHQGRLGALLLQMPDGQRFALGTGFTDAQRAQPPAIGSVVSYRYRELTASGLPRFASFLRERGPL